MKTLTQEDLKSFQEAVYKDRGIKLEGNDLFEAASTLLEFFEALIKYDQEDKQKEKEKQKNKAEVREPSEQHS